MNTNTIKTVMTTEEYSRLFNELVANTEVSTILDDELSEFITLFDSLFEEVAKEMGSERAAFQALASFVEERGTQLEDFTY